MIIKVNKVSKIYPSPAGPFTALQDADLEINQGELLLILGPSGSGKTTLLSLLGCLIDPSSGDLEIEGQGIRGLSSEAMAKIRLQTIGFVFQQFNLLAPLTAEENVAFPLKMLGLKAKEIQERSLAALAKVQMSAHRHKLPKQLSGGQQQRIAIARALVTNPKVLLCDEPTASLDKESLEIVMQELRALAAEGKAVAVVTHDPRLIPFADRAIEVENGIVRPLQNLQQVLH